MRENSASHSTTITAQDFLSNVTQKKVRFRLDPNSSPNDSEFASHITMVEQEQIFEAREENYNPFIKLTAVGEAGASYHFLNNKEGFFDPDTINKIVKGVSGKVSEGLKGKRKVQVR